MALKSALIEGLAQSMDAMAMPRDISEEGTKRRRMRRRSLSR